ncbi:hypothetical protein EPO44_05895 [bacterium]|nr:MAG: hypothetical protein EPO44_05895 [bacterium]
MGGILAFILGAISGFSAHAIAMKVNFKQRTIDNKIKVFDGLIGQWVQMRNYIYANYPGVPGAVAPEIIHQFDQIYGESQRLVGEAFLVCEDEEMSRDINALNERIYRTEWHTFTLDQANEHMEQIKIDAIALITRMREDIKRSTRFEWQDFKHIVSGFSRRAGNA